MTWQERARIFHENNPKVYCTLVDYVREAVTAGHTRIGIELPWNRMRWEYLFKTNNSPFKLNQNYKAFYARLIMSQEPDLSDVFEIRALRDIAA